MTRDLWMTGTEHDTAYGMDYETGTGPDGQLWHEDVRPVVDPDWDDDEAYEAGR